MYQILIELYACQGYLSFLDACHVYIWYTNNYCKILIFKLFNFGIYNLMFFLIEFYKYCRCCSSYNAIYCTNFIIVYILVTVIGNYIMHHVTTTTL